MKSTILTGLGALALLAFSCKKEAVQNPQQKASQSAVNNTAHVAGHFVGEKFGGGVIFYLSADKLHGLIADSADLPATGWYNGTYTITGVTATNIGSGKSNTRAIIIAQGKPGKYAALECAKSKRNGFTDWFLPSRDELHELYIQQNLVGTFSFGFYWTSSEIHDSSVFSWGEYFYSGAQFGSSKNATGFVRAVRSF